MQCPYLAQKKSDTNNIEMPAHSARAFTSISIGPPPFERLEHSLRNTSSERKRIMRTQQPYHTLASPFAPMAPACPYCNELMSLAGAESWTLLRGHQLGKYTFECGDCGHTVSRMVDEDR